MSQELQTGDKVKYQAPDGKWHNGSIHGVRKVDTTRGRQRVISYLVDTGLDEHLTVYRHSLRSITYHAEHRKHLAAGKSPKQADKLALGYIEKLPEEIVETTERQPQQVDVPVEAVKPR